MTAVRLGQQRSQAVGLGFESLSCQIFLRFTLSIFWCSKLVKHWRVPLGCFSALWDKKFSTENLDTTPPLIQIFSVPEINATIKDSPTGIFGTVRQKNFDGKSWYYSPPPLIQIFSVREINATMKDSPTEIFGTVRQKIFVRKSWYSPLPYYP